MLSSTDGALLGTIPLLPPTLKADGAAPKPAEVKCLAFRQQPEQPLG